MPPPSRSVKALGGGVFAREFLGRKPVVVTGMGPKLKRASRQWQRDRLLAAAGSAVVQVTPAPCRRGPTVAAAWIVAAAWATSTGHRVHRLLKPPPIAHGGALQPQFLWRIPLQL